MFNIITSTIDGGGVRHVNTKHTLSVAFKRFCRDSVGKFANFVRGISILTTPRKNNILRAHRKP